MKKHIPISLVVARLIMGVFIVILACVFGKTYSNMMVALVITGFLADILDGIIARYTGTSSSRLRVIDTNADRAFWLMVLFSCYQLYPEFIISKLFSLVAVLGLDALVYLVSIVRFKKTPSPHNLLTKLWGIMIAISLTEILISGSAITFNLMIVIGFISRTDSLLIYCILRKWAHDIPSFYQAIQINEGKPIKRFKLFNG